MLTMGTVIFGLHLLIVVAAIAQSYLIKCCSESVEKYSKAGSIRVSLNQGMANYVILSTLFIRGIPLKSVAQSLFTAGVRHAIANVYSYLCFLLRIV